MGDSEEEQIDIEELREEYEATLSKVLSFPEKVTRPCHIPLSKVAFIPGNFIHTNEFKVEGEDKITSYTETAALLRKKMKDLGIQIQGDDHLAETTSANEQDDEDATNSFFEIREFMDSDGTLTSHELIDISKEMSSSSKSGKEQRSKNKIDPNSKQEAVLQALEKSLMDVGSNAKSDDIVSKDPEMAFAHELRKLPKSNNPGSKNESLDFLDNLSLDEDEERAKSRINKLELDHNSKKTTKDDDGWKRGFFNASKNDSKSSSKQVPEPKISEKGIAQKKPIMSMSAFSDTIVEKNI